jgi:hypothetical protein
MVFILRNIRHYRALNNSIMLHSMPSRKENASMYNDCGRMKFVDTSSQCRLLALLYMPRRPPCRPTKTSHSILLSARTLSLTTTTTHHLCKHRYGPSPSFLLPNTPDLNAPVLPPAPFDRASPHILVRWRCSRQLASFPPSPFRLPLVQ